MVQGDGRLGWRGDRLGADRDCQPWPYPWRAANDDDVHRRDDCRGTPGRDDRGIDPRGRRQDTRSDTADEAALLARIRNLLRIGGDWVAAFQLCLYRAAGFGRI